MVFSSQRLIIIIIAINLMIGITAQVHQGLETPDLREVSAILGVANNTVYQSTKDEVIGKTGTVTESDQYEQSPGTIEMGFAVIETLIKGVNPFSVHPLQFKDPLLKSIAVILIGFRIILGSIIVIEAFLIWRNKKAT